MGSLGCLGASNEGLQRECLRAKEKVGVYRVIRKGSHVQKGRVDGQQRAPGQVGFRV